MPWPIRLGPEPRMITAGLLARRDLGLLVVGRVVVRRAARRTRRRRCRRSCRPAGCRARAARRGRRRRVRPRIRPICASEKPCRLARRSSSGRQLGGGGDLAGDLVDQAELVEEPRVDAGGVEDLLGGGAGPERVHHLLAAGRRAGRADLREQRVLVEVDVARWCQSNGASLLLQRAQRLLQRLGEVAADRHRLADRLHVRGQRRVGAGELLEREPRHLDHDVVERRLEAAAGVSAR